MSFLTIIKDEKWDSLGFWSVVNLFAGYAFPSQFEIVVFFCIGVRPRLVLKSIGRLKVSMPFTYSLVSNIFLVLNMKA